MGHTALIVILGFIISLCVFAQWEYDLRLTNNSSYSYTSYNNARCIAASGNKVHVVWWDNRYIGTRVFYKNSTDNGINWGMDTDLTANSFYSTDPSIAANGDAVHLVWADTRNMGIGEIYYKRSVDGGLLWGEDIRLTDDPAVSGNPCIAVSGQYVHVVWIDRRLGPEQAFYKGSKDGGYTWSADFRLSFVPQYSRASRPSVSASGSYVYVVWSDTRNSEGDEIYYRRSSDSGNTWGPEIRLTNYYSQSYNSCVSAFGSFVHVAWADGRFGGVKVCYKRSTDNGVTWSADRQITSQNGNGDFPSIISDGPVIHIISIDTRDGNDEIYYDRSTNYGINWDANLRLTNNSGDSQHPSAAISGMLLHIVWQDNRDGNFEVYYKRNPTGNIVGIKNINTKSPENFSLSQNYPNPFNPVTIIKFEIPNQKSETNSKTEIRIYDILGREVTTLVNEKLSPGTYEVKWEGINYASGIYYYTLSAGEFIETKKMVLIR